MEGFPSGIRIRSIKMRRDKGGAGTMIITAVAESNASAVEGANPTYEIEWVEVQKALKSHPRYMIGQGVGGGFTGISTDGWLLIKNYEDASETAARDAIRDEVAETFAEMEGTLILEYMDKFDRGHDSYVLYSPVVRETTTWRIPPETGPCGVRDTPPSAANPPSGYSYLLTADRAPDNGDVITRTKEWTGADWVDTDIYPEAA